MYCEEEANIIKNSEGIPIWEACKQIDGCNASEKTGWMCVSTHEDNVGGLITRKSRKARRSRKTRKK